jgi:hypothetical protein
MKCGRALGRCRRNGGGVRIRLRPKCRALIESESGIQNGGVRRMSGMSSMLCIPLYRDALSHHEP